LKRQNQICVTCSPHLIALARRLSADPGASTGLGDPRRHDLPGQDGSAAPNASLAPSRRGRDVGRPRAVTAESCPRAAEAPGHPAPELHSVSQGTKLGDGELLGNVFPPFSFNSSVRHCSEMVLFTHGSRETAEQRGSFFYTSCYLCSLRNVAEFNGCVTRGASVHEREAASGGDAQRRNAARWGPLHPSGEAFTQVGFTTCGERSGHILNK